MQGLVEIGIILSVIWILYKAIQEGPDDALKQTPWYRFKRNFRAGKIYYLFAARTKDRLTGELFIYYILLGMGLIIPIGTLVDEARPILNLSDFNRIDGHLSQVNLSSSICKSSITILEKESSPYTTCLVVDKGKRLRKIIGQPVVVWVAEERTFFGFPTAWVKQLQYGNDLIINYADIRIAEKNSHNNILLFFGFVPFLFSLASLWTIAKLNIKKYGPWHPAPNKKTSAM